MLRQLEGVTRSGMRLQEHGLSTALAGELFVDGVGRRTVAVLRGEMVAIILVVVWMEVLVVVVVVVVVGGMIVATTTATAGGCATCGGATATAATVTTILCQLATP